MGSSLVRLGLNYSQVYAVMRMRGVKKMSRMLDQVKLIERGAMAAMNGVTLEDLYG